MSGAPAESHRSDRPIAGRSWNVSTPGTSAPGRAGALDATTTIEAIAGAEPWESFELDDVVAHRPGADTTILTYVASALRRDAPPYRALVSSCDRRTGDSWELVVHHQTPPDA